LRDVSPKSGRAAAHETRATALILLLALMLGGGAAAQSWPEPEWTKADPASSGWPAEKLAKAERQAADLRLTAVMIVQHGKVIAAWGDTTAKLKIHSMRKSLLSALYGIGVSEGSIDLSRTLEDLAIYDSAPALTDTEKTATIRDLLMARSGVYHAAVYEDPDMKAKRPARGSYPPGAFWYYNNWDFNALGTIYEQLTKARVFNSFEQRIARVVGMEDYKPSDGRYMREPESIHPAYAFSMSARDLARFGLLFLNGGRWKDKQIIPASWVKESTAAHTASADLRGGYGYLWWRASESEGRGLLMGADSYFALGYGGQMLAVVPSRDLIIVKLVDHIAYPVDARRAATAELLRSIMSAAAGPD
jgi:CubicO group peptidase (beta-lactamase class C family)